MQNLFAIVQGGLEPDLRDKCLDEMIARRDEVTGYAIGGLSGGEEKGNPQVLGFGNLCTYPEYCRHILENVWSSSSDPDSLI